MNFKKIAFKLHLWLGYTSGLVVFIVCITGAIWAVGINGWIGSTSNSIQVPIQQEALIQPSLLEAQARESLQGERPSLISYTKGEAAQIRVFGDELSLSIMANPYTGEVLEVTDYNQSGEYQMTFWDYIRWGHRALWLPWDIGRPIVNYSTLAFLITLVTGLIIWIPKTWKGLKPRMWFKWKKKTPNKRRMYDLHLVLGFYSSFLLLVISCTGMVWGIEWWSKATYTVTTGDSLPEWTTAQSDTLNIDTEAQLDLTHAIDKIFFALVANNPNAESITINYPDTTDARSAISTRVSHDKTVLYNYDSQAYDRYTLQEITLDGYQHGRYADKAFGEKLRRQNYDLHIGAAWGTVGRILMFFAALFGASLPLTGYYITYKVKKRKKKAKLKK